MPETPPTRKARATREEHDHLVLHPRDVRFDWSRLPMHWVPGEPMATHVLNVLHLLLPEGERWFVRTFREALPLITDEGLRDDVLGFIGQEAIHAEAHQGVQDHLLAKGLDPLPYVRQVEYLFHRILGARPGLSPVRSREHLLERVAVIAAIEHFTAFLGDWVLNADGLDRAGADPTMLDLLRWHGAEEVEHRSVAYDLLQHLDPRYARRVRTMVVTGPVMVQLWIRGTRYLMAADPGLGPGARPRWRDYAAAARRGLLPGGGRILISAGRYLRRDYHPTQEGSTQQAVAYLGTSPAARAAAH
ncbi:metal-dependent hydrolase [Streptomyces sp. NBC_01803]|uniref:metal-dependent hydrolase n=1 Tax=Streptomyces sp. NBC_01803 TaxID=2975946 RepID=UPI002DD910EE|nr:metal-dependent hydrolase [Streptomyces sp. NBC_01803]WSA43174.1 metal-dependent hydrolase [Streptomyces sp. NBC_01803]